MNLDDFGTSCARINHRTMRSSNVRSTPTEQQAADDKPGAPVQWRIAKHGVYQACGVTCPTLPAGAYTSKVDNYQRPQFVAKNLQVDDLIDFDSGIPSQVLREIDEFWTLGDNFRRHGFLHRRGYLFYGAQGCGKSSVVHQIVARIIAAGHVAVFAESVHYAQVCLDMFRKVEPDRPVVCIFEDIDSIIEEQTDAALLQWLDGYHQIDCVVNLATTNYPENLDRRLVSRPRRFDRIIKIEPPRARTREAYFVRKLPSLPPAELSRWVRLSEGLSFAALAELVISVACLNNRLEDSVQMLRMMDEQSPPSSREYQQAGAMGFGAVNRENGNGDGK